MRRVREKEIKTLKIFLFIWFVRFIELKGNLFQNGAHTQQKMRYHFSIVHSTDPLLLCCVWCFLCVFVMCERVLSGNGKSVQQISETIFEESINGNRFDISLHSKYVIFAICICMILFSVCTYTHTNSLTHIYTIYTIWRFADIHSPIVLRS